MAFTIQSPEVSSISGCRRISTPKFVSKPNPRTIQDLRILKRNCGVSVRVSSKTKDVEARVSDLERNVWLYGQLQAPVMLETTSSKQKKEDEEKQNYYVNMGYAIRTLREEFPELFYKELSFDIYRDDIVFRDPLNTFMGIENYKSIFWALRFHGRMFFKALWIDIISVWQPVESTVMVRWTVHGIPRVPWESKGRFDGTSEYKLDKNGKIFEHRVHNIALNEPPKFRVLVMEELILSLGCPSTPKPTYYKTSSALTVNLVSILIKLERVKHYLASTLASDQVHDTDSSLQ